MVHILFLSLPVNLFICTKDGFNLEYDVAVESEIEIRFQTCQNLGREIREFHGIVRHFFRNFNDPNLQMF